MKTRTLVILKLPKSDSTTPQLHDQQTCPRAQVPHAGTNHARESWRSGVLIVRPGPVNTHSTPVLGPPEAVGRSQTTHHSTPTATHNEPAQQTLDMRRQSLAWWAEPWSKPWQQNHCERDGTGGARYARPHVREDRYLHAADPDADREVPSSCAPSDGAGGCARGGLSRRVPEPVEKEMINNTFTLPKGTTRVRLQGLISSWT